jgi:hypothetical protein
MENIKGSNNKSQYNGFSKCLNIFKKMDETLAQLTCTKKNMSTGTKLLSFYVQDLLDLAELKAGTIKKNIEYVNINIPLQEIIQTQEL